MDFNKVKINCSALPSIMSSHKLCKPLSEKQELELASLKLRDKLSEPQKKKLDTLTERVKNIGNIEMLSNGAISKLKEVYVREKYNKQVVSIGKDYSPAILNGVMSESKVLSLISDFEGIKCKLHKKVIYNSFLKGILDAYIGKSAKKATKVIEIKTCQNMQSLMSVLDPQEAYDKYYWQIMGYLAITGAEEGTIYHCVVTYPERIINDEINKFIYKAKVFGLDGGYVEQQIERIRFNLSFDDIPINERIYKFSVQRDENIIKDIYKKVKYCRGWLNDYDKMHSNLYSDVK